MEIKFNPTDKEHGIRTFYHYDSFSFEQAMNLLFRPRGHERIKAIEIDEDGIGAVFENLEKTEK